MQRSALGLLMLAIGVPSSCVQPVECASSADCQDSEVCAISEAGGECISAEEAKDCDSDLSTLAEKSVEVKNASDQVVLTFSFSQRQLSAPSPCVASSSIFATITNNSSSVSSFTYTVNFVDPVGGASRGDYSNTVLGLAAGASVDAGIVLPGGADLESLNPLVISQPF